MLNCGHHESNLDTTVETRTEFCRMCDLISRCNDAESREKELFAQLETERECRQAAEKSIAAIPAICRGEAVACAYHVSGPITEMRANLIAQIRRLEKK